MFFERPLIVILIFILISFLVGMDLQAKRFYNKKETQIFHESENLKKTYNEQQCWWQFKI